MSNKSLNYLIAITLLCSLALEQPVAARFEPKQNEQQQQQGWMPNIKFDRSWTIVRIEFLGNVKTRDQVVRRAMLLREDDSFDQELLKRSLRRLNRLQLFEQVQEKNVMWRLGKEPKQVALIFHVKERER